MLQRISFLQHSSHKLFANQSVQKVYMIKGIDGYFKELQESTHIDEQVQWHPGGSLVRGHIHDVGAFVYVLSPLCQIHAVLETIRAHEKNTNTMKYILCLINMSDENNG